MTRKTLEQIWSQGAQKLFKQGENMTRRRDTNLDRLAAEAGIELTPAIRRFAWLVNQDSLQGFWEAAQHYAKFEQEKVDRFLKEKWND